MLDIYMAFYGRPADPDGLAFWAGRLNAANGNLDEIMDAFATSPEYEERFGHLGLEGLVSNLFQQLFGRAPDTAGLAFYIEVLESGERTLQSISLDILNGAQNDDALIVQNRVEISSHYITSLEEAGANASQVDADTLASWVADVDADSSSAATACGAIDVEVGLTQFSVSGSWSSSGGAIASSDNNPVYQIQVIEARQVTIELSSNTVDTYLYLLDEDGAVIAENDDIVLEVNTNSRLNRALEEGIYQVVAATYWDGESGDFELSLTGAIFSRSGSSDPLAGSISPFQLIELSGDFDPENSAISVLLTSQSTGVTVTVPVLSATATAVEFLMPPLVDRESGELMQGRVDVEILQAGTSVVSRTQVLGSPLILAPVAIDSDVSRGDWTIAYILAGIDSLSRAAELSSELNLGNDTAEDLVSLSAEMESLLNLVQTLAASGTAQSFSTSDGAAIQMDSNDLDTLDSLISAYFSEFSGPASEAQLHRAAAGLRPAAQLAGGVISRCEGNEGLSAAISTVCGSNVAVADNAVTAGGALRSWGKYIYGLPLALSSIPLSTLLGTGAAGSAMISVAYGWLADHLAQTPTTVASTVESILVSGAGSKTGIQLFGQMYGLIKNFVTTTGDIDGSDPDDQAPEKGAVQVNWEQSDEQGEIIVTHTPADGSAAVHMRLPASGSSASTSSLRLVAPPDDAAILVSWAGDGNGTTSGPGISCPGDCTEIFDLNETITLTASADNGSTFTGWSGACTGTGSCTVVLDRDKTVTATFEKNAAILVSAQGNGSVSGPGISCPGDCTEIFDLNESITLTATPDSDSTFTGWSGDCSGIGSCTVVLSRDRSVTGNFELKDDGSYSTLHWNITDSCDDNSALKLRFFDRTDNLVWPDSSNVYTYANLGQTYISSLSCMTDNKICYGGESSAGSRSWGLGLSGERGCDACCYSCADRTVSNSLTCSGGGGGGGDTVRCENAATIETGPSPCQCDPDPNIGLFPGAYGTILSCPPGTPNTTTVYK